MFLIVLYGVLAFAAIISSIYLILYSKGFNAGKGEQYKMVHDSTYKIADPLQRKREFNKLKYNIYIIIWIVNFVLFPVTVYTLIRYKGEVFKNE